MRKDRFLIPDNVIYLDGNSLGPLPKEALTRVNNTTRNEWGELLITGWNKAGWMVQPSLVGDRIAKLIGAKTGSVVLGDTLSIKVYQALAAALKMRPERNVILSDTGNFPTDLYMAEGLIKTTERDIELRTVDPEAVYDSLEKGIAVLMLTEVDYRTGRKHDMMKLTRKAHELGIVTIWDLAHSAGAIPVDLEGSGTEFAVGCTYKYLNGGPGAPAFIYVRPDLAATVEPCLAGWLGHKSPFDFDLDYTPAPSIDRMRVGTPPVLQIAALDAALNVWDGISLAEIRARSIELSELFIKRVEDSCKELKLVSPRDPHERGSQVSFAFEESYAAMQALIANKVIGDFRAPDIMRFGITPLYLNEQDIEKAAEILKKVIKDKLWDNPKYKTRELVT